MLISEEHRSAETRRHISDPEYGGEAIAWAQQISTIINAIQCDTALDYGAGKGELHRHLELDHRVAVHLYDPAIPAISHAPEPQEIVLCINVLDHVEEASIDAVLDDLKRCTQRTIFMVLNEDRPMEWWLPKVMERFSIQSLVRSTEDFYIIANAKGN